MKRKAICVIDEDEDASPMNPTKADEWLRTLKTAKKSRMRNGTSWRVLCKFPNEKQLLEEYDASTGCTVRRAWREPTPLDGTPDWRVELGEPPPSPPVDLEGLRESNDQPILTRRSTKKCLEWRIRNLPYPIETYSINVDVIENCIIIKTTNKKYYKKLKIPEMERIGLAPIQASIDYMHKFNTLIVTYKKPPELINFEKLWLEELNKAEDSEGSMDDCKIS